MRKPRVVIYDDDPLILDVLGNYFSLMHYEVQSFSEPLGCPVFEHDLDTCVNVNPCADIIITDFAMPRMNGLELLRYQTERGCKLTIRNKAILSGYVHEEYRGEIQKSGCAFFRKPISFSELSAWVTECEGRIELSHPLGMKRRALRSPISKKIMYDISAQDGKFEGNVMNISEFGLCLKVNIPLLKDQLLSIYTELPNSCRKASVRWTKRIADDMFLAGLSCC